MKLIDSLPEFGHGIPEIYDCSDGVFMKLYHDVTADDFELYEKELEKVGFSVFDKHTMCGNVYYTVKKDFTVCLYRSTDSQMRVIADDYSSEYECKPSTVQRNNFTELYQFETDHSLIDCGMCYIIKCSDGSFFVIDSAHFYSMRDNDRIHDFLRNMTPENEKIRIAGWFISHGHVDHFTQFKNYLLYNMKDTVVERIYMNLISTSHKDSFNWEVSDKTSMEEFRKTVNNSGIPVVKLHSGQRFFVRNLCFEVLCTHEDVFPETNKDFNDSSTVLMMTAEETRVLFPGDAAIEESKILENRFGSYLECDIVQMSHHGHCGTSEKFYRFANAKTVLCPNTQIKFDEELHHFKANEVAVDIAEEFYVSSNGTVRLVLPYKIGTADVFPDETTENFEGIRKLWGYEYSDEFKEKHNKEFCERNKKQ